MGIFKVFVLNPSSNACPEHAYIHLTYAMLSRARCGDLRAFSARKIQCRYYSDEISRPSQHGIDSKPAHGRESDERSPKEKAHTFHQSRRVFSGIQPTGVPHLGNYLGALRQWKFLHDSSANAALLSNAKPEQYFSVVDLHALTSFDPEKRPGVSNLIEILRTVTSISDSAEKIAKDLEHMTMRAFKEMVADNVSECLRGIRESFLDLMEPTNHTLNDEVREGARKAHARASWTMKNVRNSLGLQTLKIPSGEAEPENANDAGEDDAHDPQTDVHEVKIRYCKSETAGAIQEALAGLSKQSFPASEPENSAKSRS